MNMRKILPIISIVLGIISIFEGFLTLNTIPLRGWVGKILLAPAECIGVSEKCPAFLYLGIFIFVSLTGVILGVITLAFNIRKFRSILEIIACILGIGLSLIGLIIWLINWILTIIPLAA
jgi:hypothetical protein